MSPTFWVWLLLAAPGASYLPQWTQPRFLLSLWYDPVVPCGDFAKRYAEIAAANFTAVMGGFGAVTPDAVRAQLAAAQASNLGVIAAAAAGISDYNQSSALWGFQIKDEPSADQFPGLAAQTRQIAATVPGKLRFINLLPNCSTSQLNASSYQAYVRDFVDIVQPDVLCVDYYPSFATPADSPDPSMDGYKRNLAVLRSNARRRAVLELFWCPACILR